MNREFLEVMEQSEANLPSMAARAARLANFNESLDRFMNLVNSPHSHHRDYMIQEAATVSDFPILLGTVLERTLLAKYLTAKPDWRNYIKTGTQRDFRPTDAIGIFGLQGQLPEKPIRGEYKKDAELGEGKMPQITLKSYGRRFGFGWEVLINDDLGAFNDIADRLNTAAQRTEWKHATELFAASTGPNTTLFGSSITHPIDSVSINNKSNKPLTMDNLANTMQTMRHQLDVDGEPIIIDGFDLVFPPALELQARKILRQTELQVSGGDATAGAVPAVVPVYNVLQDFSITPHMNPYLPIIDTSGKADTTWYLFANQASGVAVIMKFLAGHETPEVVMKAPNKLSLGGGAMSALEGDFETDSITWRVRDIHGGTQFDPRMAYAQTGS